jgi:hypothetical protein
MSGWLRHFTLSAQARTGFSVHILVWFAVAAVAAVAACMFLAVAVFLWLTLVYDPVTAGLVLAGFFLLITLIALTAALLARRRNMERARRELAAARSGGDWLDPRLLAIGLQVGQAIGWRRLLSLAALALLVAGVTREWRGGGDEPPEK